MMLVETSAVPVEALPLAGFRDHLRLGRGFDPIAGEAALLEGHLRTAIAVIERRIAKALIQRGFVWELAAWRDADVQALPLAPVVEVTRIATVDAEGLEAEIPSARWRLAPDLHRPRILGRDGALPSVPSGHRLRLEFEAGFGPDWADVPADLARAVFLLAAEYHDHREAEPGRDALPRPVLALIEGWRLVRVLGGRGA